MMWQRCPGGWSAADLSAGGRVTGNANSEDRRGDILINDDAGKRAWVRTPDGTAHPLRALPGSAGVYARQINDRGWIAGAVYGPAPGFLTTGTLWKGYRAAPLAVHPLPFPGSDDATLLGLDDRGDAVGNSDNADFSDGAGGVWRA